MYVLLFHGKMVILLIYYRWNMLIIIIFISYIQYLIGEIHFNILYMVASVRFILFDFLISCEVKINVNELKTRIYK